MIVLGLILFAGGVIASLINFFIAFGKDDVSDSRFFGVHIGCSLVAFVGILLIITGLAIKYEVI